MATRHRRRRGHWAATRPAGPPGDEDVEARAARLGITVDRVLREYRRIAFANLRHILEWNGEGMEVKPSKDLTDDDVAAIAEIVEAAAPGKPHPGQVSAKKPPPRPIPRHPPL